jgi:hypothetical protein
MVEADVVQGGAEAKLAMCPPTSELFAVGADHHGHGVPADVVQGHDPIRAWPPEAAGRMEINWSFK